MSAVAPSFDSFLDSLKAEGSAVALSPERLAERLELPLRALALLGNPLAQVLVRLAAAGGQRERETRGGEGPGAHFFFPLALSFAAFAIARCFATSSSSK